MASLKEAVKILKGGGLVGFPTESFWAVAADATNSRAVKLVYTLKARKKNKPLALIAADLSQVKKYFRLTETERLLGKQYWPAGLTMILRPRAKISSRALGASEIGVRVPAHAGARTLAKKLGRPVTATSLNISGQAPTKSRRKIQKQFPGLALLSGNCGQAVRPSTVISLDGQQLCVWREGPVRF